MDNRHFGGPRPLPGCRPSFGDLEFSAAEINELLKRLIKMQDVEGLVSGVNIVNIENHELLQPGNLTLEDLGAARLANMNDVFVPWQGSAYATRNYLPSLLRRKGISISYVTDKGIAVKERAVSDVGIDNANWGIDSNWMRVDELSLNGELYVSPNGTWVINGVDTGIQSLGPKGDNGLTPRLKTIDNKLHYSYDGKEWVDSEGEYISAWFRWSGNKIQISRDNKTWEDFSGEFADNLFIKGYVATFDKLPADAVQGDIWGVGPRYAAEDTEQTQPIYRYWVRNAGGWVDNGEFTSIAAGIVQETGDGENVVMSQKAVSEKLSELESEIGQTKNTFVITKGTSHSSTKDQINVDIKKGEGFKVILENQSTDGAAVYLTYSDGSEGAISLNSFQIAEKTITSIGVYIDGQYITETKEVTLVVVTNYLVESSELQNKIKPSLYDWLYCPYGAYPFFTGTDMSDLTISFNEGSIITLYSALYGAINIPSERFGTIILPAWKVALYNIETNEVVIGNLEEVYGENFILLLARSYGYSCGLLAPYYEHWKTMSGIASELQDLKNDLGIAKNTFVITKGTSHSSTKDQINVDIKKGEGFKVILENQSTDGAAVYLTYSDGSEGAISLNSFQIAEKTITSIGVYIDGQYITETKEVTLVVVTNYLVEPSQLKTDNIPPYFENQLATAKNEIIKHSTIGKDGVQFAFISDTHWANNRKNSPYLMRRIINETPIRNIVMGGDYISSYTSKEVAKRSLNDAVEAFCGISDYVFPIYGNHDRNSMHDVSADARISLNEAFTLMFGKLPKGVEFGDELNYFYDNNATRFVFLQSASSGHLEGIAEYDIPPTSLNWLDKILSETPNGYHVVIFVHAMGYSNENVDDFQFTYSDGGTELMNKVDSVNALGNIRVDAIFSGHIHYDYTDKTTNGVPVIFIDTDSTRVPNGVDASVGTINEQCMDFVTIDWKNKVIYCDRVGRGKSRIINWSAK